MRINNRWLDGKVDRWIGTCFFLTILLSSHLTICLFSASPKKDPDADKTYKNIKRGSQEDIDILKKDHIPLADEKGKTIQKDEKDQPQQETLTENPVEKLKKRKHIKHGKNKKGDYTVKYKLEETAKIKITIQDKDQNTVREYNINPEDAGTKKGEHKITVWDGKDGSGNQSPEGTYTAVVFVEYPDGKSEVNKFELIK